MRNREETTSISVIILEFWEDDGEIRIGGRAGMVPPQEESEDGDRVSFPRWGKRNVVSHHFTENSFLKSRKWGQNKRLKRHHGTCRFECDTLVFIRRIP